MSFKKSAHLPSFVFCLAVAELFFVHGSLALSQERKVSIAYAGPSLIALPFLAAQEWKLFSQNGLSAQLIVMTFTISIPALSVEQVNTSVASGRQRLARHLEEFLRALSGSLQTRFSGP